MHANQQAATTVLAAAPVIHQLIDRPPATQIKVPPTKTRPLRNFEGILQSIHHVLLNIVKDAWHSDSLLALSVTIPSHTVLDVVVDDEVQFFVSEAVVFGEDAIYLIHERFRVRWIKFLELNSIFSYLSL